MMNSLRIALMLLPLHAAAATPDTALEALKSFEGKWAIQSAGKTLAIEMSYDIGSNGSIVTEQFGKELSVFYRDGPALLMTHFCNVGNQPRLRLKENSEPGLLEFEMFDITNLKEPNAAHVQRAIYRLVDDRKIQLELVWREGAQEDSEKYTLDRK